MGLLPKKRSICLRGIVRDLSEPLLMGIINYTGDSFYEGSRYSDPSAAVDRAGVMIEEGADIIDVGAVSTRPGSTGITGNEEIRRLSEVLGAVRHRYPDIPVSVDTFRSNVARIAVSDFGADMINDISCGYLDNKMAETIASLQVPYVAMHMQGTPATMQNNPVYDDVVNDIIRFLSDRVEMMHAAGINDIIVDPGFGFGKSIEHNYSLIGRLEDFAVLGLPLLVGISRKSFIYRLLDVAPVEALTGTVALNAVALLKGADILRVHDVKEARETVKVVNYIKVCRTGNMGV